MTDSKTNPFASWLKYLGFVWDIPAKTIEIPKAKKACYLAKLEPWTPNHKFSKKDAESVLSTLVHCSLVLSNVQSCLPAISHFTSSFDHFTLPFICLPPSLTVASNIAWWWSQLSSSFCSTTLSKPPAASSIKFWVDASSLWGIGVIFGGLWDAWKLKTGWHKDGHNISWAEIVAIKLGLLLAIHLGYFEIHFLIKSDNQGVIQAIKGRKSRNFQQNLVLQCIMLLLS